MPLLVESVSAKVLLPHRHAVLLPCNATGFTLIKTRLVYVLSLKAKLPKAALNMPCCHSIAGHVQNSPAQTHVVLSLTSAYVAAVLCYALIIQETAFEGVLCC